MRAAMLNKLLPWSLRGWGPFLNTFGDPVFFRSVRSTPPLAVNPQADTSIHSIVGHRFVHQYLVAIKSFLRFFNDIAVFVHDDGSLTINDRKLLQRHLPGLRIQVRAEADAAFDRAFNDPFLSKVRKSYTSYLKLFDPTFLRNGKRIILLDTDTLFIRRPASVIQWAQAGGQPWYHVAPKGNMKKRPQSTAASGAQDVHIQTLIMRELDEINERLQRSYRIEQGFCAGFVGYDVGIIEFGELKRLLEALFDRFGDRIYRWGSEQTIHGLMLCGQGARALPIEDYFVFTQHNANRANHGTFVHFVGENRFYRMIYPRLAGQVVRELKSNS